MLHKIKQYLLVTILLYNKECIMCIPNSSKKYNSEYTGWFTSRLLMARSCCLISSCNIAGLRAISMVCTTIHSSQVPVTKPIQHQQAITLCYVMAAYQVPSEVQASPTEQYLLTSLLTYTLTAQTLCSVSCSEFIGLQLSSVPNVCCVSHSSAVG